MSDYPLIHDERAKRIDAAILTHLGAAHLEAIHRAAAGESRQGDSLLCAEVLKFLDQRGSSH